LKLLTFAKMTKRGLVYALFLAPFLTLIISGFFFVFLEKPVFASVAIGTIDSVHKHAWGENIGWVNFGCSNCSVQITDSAITGYAWSDNYGWINLNPTHGGITNNGEGNLAGHAWGENLGWIDFAGVVIDNSGKFTGNASGAVSGVVNFDCVNCDIRTNWRPRSVRAPALAPALGSPKAPEGDFRVLINNNAEYTDSFIVTLNLFGGPDTARMTISNNIEFSGAGSTGRIPYQSLYLWSLCLGRENICEKLRVGELTSYEFRVYAKFFAPWGISSKIVSDTIVYRKERPIIEIPEIIREAPEIIRRIPERIRDILRPKPPEIKLPEVPLIEELVPKEAPLTMRGKWSLLGYTRFNFPFTKFSLAPLPREFQRLVQKFPELGQTFAEVGIQRLIDVKKLKTVKLTLPGLTERVGLPTVRVEPGKFALPQGIPIAKLSPEIQELIPSEIVFARTGGESIDFDVTLSVTEEGEPQKKISTIVGKPLQLVVRPDKPVKSIRGYVVFRSKTPRVGLLGDYKLMGYGLTGYGLENSQLASSPTHNRPINQPAISLSSLSASLIFTNPVFAHPVRNEPMIFVAGAKPQSSYSKLLDRASSAEISNGASPQDKPVRVEEILVLLEFEYIDPDGDGIYTAEIQTPLVEGEYEIITVMDFEDPKLGKKEIRLITVIDPEGYIYERDGDKETRIPGAIVSIFWLNPETKQYELWPAEEYQQENPQTTDVRGTYSFLVPEGFYYLKVETPGYLTYDGKPFQVKEGSGVHINIELKTKYWWLRIVDWKTILLIAVILLLFYNFYRDKMRERA
jgi:hypothetical protein